MAQLYTLALTVLGAGSIIVAPVSAGDVIVKSKCPIVCSRCLYGIDTTLPCPGCCCPCYDPCKKTVCPGHMQTQVVSWNNWNTGKIAGTCCICVCESYSPYPNCWDGLVYVATDFNHCTYYYCSPMPIPRATNMTAVRRT